jgi:hypothetical protein
MNAEAEVLPVRFLHATPIAGAAVRHTGAAIEVAYIAGGNTVIIGPNHYGDTRFNALDAAALRLTARADHDLSVRVTLRSKAWQASHTEVWGDLVFAAGRSEAALDLRDFRLAQNTGGADLLTLLFDAPAEGRLVLEAFVFEPHSAQSFFAPRVDRWGQRLAGAWPGKVRSDDDLRADAELPLPAPLESRDAFAAPARLSASFEGTGFFRLAEADGTHWLVTPGGRPFLSAGPCCVSYGPVRTIVQGRDELFDDIPGREGPEGAAWQDESSCVCAELHPERAFGGDSESTKVCFPVANLVRKYGADWRARWMDRTRARLASWGMNTFACWSDIAFARETKMPYLVPAERESTVDWGPLRRQPGDEPFPLVQTPDVFHPEFEARSEHWFDHLTAYRDDPHLLGYFVHNEEKWCAWHSPFALPKRWASRRVFVDELRDRYGDVETLNRAWSSRFRDWEHLFHFVREENPPGLSEAGIRDCDDFMRRFADRYFDRIRDRLRAVDPNHLFWGCRFLALPPRQCLLDGIAPHLDVCSINWYMWHKQNLEDIPAFLGEWHRATGGLPLAITEYSFETTDERGLASRLLITDPAERVRLAAGFTEGCLALPFVVGMHWFQMIDEPVTGRPIGDGERANFGLIDVVDRPYEDLTRALAAVHRRMYEVHGTTRPD